MRVQILELQTQIANKAKSDDKKSLFSSDSEDEDYEQSKKSNRALISYVPQKVSFTKSATKKGIAKCRKKK